jgi:hypothetical protein
MVTRDAAQVLIDDGDKSVASRLITVAPGNEHLRQVWGRG